jgi:hypothetical protein
MWMHFVALNLPAAGRAFAHFHFVDSRRQKAPLWGVIPNPHAFDGVRDMLSFFLAVIFSH